MRELICQPPSLRTVGTEQRQVHGPLTINTGAARRLFESVTVDQEQPTQGEGESSSLNATIVASTVAPFEAASDDCVDSMSQVQRG